MILRTTKPQWSDSFQYNSQWNVRCTTDAWFGHADPFAKCFMAGHGKDWLGPAVTQSFVQIHAAAVAQYIEAQLVPEGAAEAFANPSWKVH